MFQKIPGNAIKHSGECSRRFRGMFQKIPRNVPEDSGECSRRFRNPNFDLFLEILLVFLSNFAVKLLQNNRKKQLLSNSSKRNFLNYNLYLKGTSFRGYLFSRAKKNCISRVLIFANGYQQKIACELIFANSKKIRFFTTRNRQKKRYLIGGKKPGEK